MVAAANLERVHVGIDDGDAFVSHVPDRGGEIVIEFDPTSYSPAEDGPAICRVVVPQQVATAWPTMQTGSRMAYRRLQRRR